MRGTVMVGPSVARTVAVWLLLARPVLTRAEPPTHEGPAGDENLCLLNEEQATTILGRARFISHSPGGTHDNIDAEFVRKVGLEPQFSLDCGNATFHFSPAFLLESGRPARIAYVDVLGSVEAHLVYRSNSQSCWRLCDLLDNHRYAKGYYEFDIQLPIPVTVVLHKLAELESPLELHLSTGERPYSDSLPEVILKGLTENYQDERKRGHLVPVAGHANGADDGQIIVRFVSRRYAERMPTYPERLLTVQNWLDTAGRRLKVADPKGLTLPEARYHPDFSKIEEQFQFHNPMYAEIRGGKGLLKGTVVRSRDRRLRYLFLEAESGQAMVAAAELADAPVNEFGLRCRYLDLAGVDAPLIEYGDQIPEEYGGVKEGDYQSNWPYLRELPMVQAYYTDQGRPIPPL